MFLPFALWLALVALVPHFWLPWWLKHYWKLALLFAGVTVAYYLLALPAAAAGTVLQTAHDYFSFIVLIGALYVVAGGIHISMERSASPLGNVCFLALGGLMANVLGTTGAAMLLIRPWLTLNKSRAAAHHVVFFIFIVANIGGGLTPIGDPPLLIGYLKGVPFWWVTQHCWLPWAVSMGLLLLAFYLFDRRSYRPPASPPASESTWSGGWNGFFLAVIVAAVFVSHPWFLREGLMLVAAIGSYLTTGKKIHEANQFSFGPILEVVVIFFGIFATMMPALDWLQGHATTILGPHPSPALVYWASGGLSSVLDSAPAYLAFASALSGIYGDMGTLPVHAAVHVAALSLGTVFFGAITYVGNGPNLMVKAVAEQQGFRAPGFPGYFFKWAVPILLPLLLLIAAVFFR